MLLMTLEAAQDRMLNALLALGPGQHSRMDLVRHLGKKHLNPDEIIALDLLVESGLIEKVLQPTKTVGISRWIYQVKDK